MIRQVIAVAVFLGLSGGLHAQITASPVEFQLEKTKSETVTITSQSSGQEINAVCFGSDTLSVSPASATTNPSKEAEFTVTCEEGDKADYGTFRRGNTDEQDRVDVNCLNSPFVFINEFSYDDEGVDDREFVELYNRSFSPVDISGWALEARDAAGFNKCFHIPANTFIPARDYFVLGSASVPNVDLVLGSTDLWENDNEALYLRSATATSNAGLANMTGVSAAGTVELTLVYAQPQYALGGIVDTIVYESRLGVWDPSLAEAEGIWGELVSIDGQETSWSRVWDGRDTKNNGADFALRPATPGASNNLGDPPYSADFDALSVGASLAGWHGTFADPLVIDPTQASAGNPNTIPASPQGGKAASFGAPSGGGNASTHLTQLIGGSVFEAYVYFDSTLPPAGQFDTWSVGFGSTGYDAPLFAGFPRDHAGVTWTYVRSSAGAVLYLIDHNDGGVGGGAITTPVVLGSIAITGANDGWKRLRIEVDRCHALGNFDGTFGLANGTAIKGLIAHNFSARSIFVSYNESIASSAIERPFTADDITIDWSTSLVHKYGAATATSSGTPTLTTDSPPTIGSSVFGFTLSGLVPSSMACLSVGTTQISAPLIGGLPGATILIGGTIVSFPLATSGGGTATYSLGMAIPMAALGMSSFWQVFDPDPLSAPPNLLGHSKGTETRFGY